MKVKDYILVTAGYWAFTLTDGALRMLVLLHFHNLGYSPVSIAFLFLLYEAMGIVTNLVGGWVGARTGLQKTLIAGLSLQTVALVALSFHDANWSEWLSVGFVMAAQAMSGVAKDLTKMSSKSAVKFVAGDGDGVLFRLVAILTGSKNALKGVGFFVGALLLSSVGYRNALLWMAGAIGAVLVLVWAMLGDDIGKSKKKPPLRSILSKSAAINRLAVARFFLFGSRDIWFVVALPVFFDEELGWSHAEIGGFMALWVIGYGVVQSFAPSLMQRSGAQLGREERGATSWVAALLVVSCVLAGGVTAGLTSGAFIVVGLAVFGVVFALNSSLHSFLILAISDDEHVSLDVGFYYSANAAGRLVGTLLSGLLYLWGGVEMALWGSALFVAITLAMTQRLLLRATHA